MLGRWSKINLFLVTGVYRLVLTQLFPTLSKYGQQNFTPLSSSRTQSPSSRQFFLSLNTSNRHMFNSWRFFRSINDFFLLVFLLCSNGKFSGVSSNIFFAFWGEVLKAKNNAISQKTYSQKKSKYTIIISNLVYNQSVPILDSNRIVSQRHRCKKTIEMSFYEHISTFTSP